MRSPQIPENEQDRLKALKTYEILDTFQETEYDEITLLASQICQTPISLLSLIDENRQWFKSKFGLDTEYTSRDIAFCAHAINDQDKAFVVPDSREDERFFDNPLVLGDPNVVFYAGIPLVTPEGFAIGTLCVIDNKPNILSEDQLKALGVLASQVIKLFELRRKERELKMLVSELDAKNKGMEAFVRVAAHDIKSPLASINMMTDLILNTFSDNMHPRGKELLVKVFKSSKKLTGLLDGILRYSIDTKAISAEKQELFIKDVVTETIHLVDGMGVVQFDVFIDESLSVFANATAIQQVLVNLLTNAIKYNDKDQTIIEIGVLEETDSLKFTVSDNGPGIKPEDHKKIFDLFTTTSNIDKEGLHGTGIGLATVKSLIENLGGNITIESEVSFGTTFIFSISK